ncbi:MAG TPA: FAD-binding protein [Saprospiraceae bacterium]|nr:FAD-binding protein [Saprospiraceae bacterium]HRO08877.1 FAD-binding protein [Saprospiraceae bacterium]HRP42130.1 FAD-binding protein [Saprospiraceae bacterium]
MADISISGEVLNLLKSKTKAEILLDDLHLGLYATDASLYQMRPLAVVIPGTEQDIIETIRIANQYNLPVLPRGTGTSLAGQTVNNALVIDFTKYYNRIIHIDIEHQKVVVQPGVVLDYLNRTLKPHNLHFAPDPATSSRATIGGMIANNSSGTKSILYGMTIDHILGLKVLLMDGTIMQMEDIDQEFFDIICKQKTRTGEIYRQFRKIIFDHTPAIDNAYPKVKRRVQGYPLDAFIYKDTWNLAKLFCGSEGTLGIILEATLHLEPLPKFKGAVTVHYDDRMQAIGEVHSMTSFSPASIEMLDYNVLDLSLKNNVTRKYYQRLIQGRPKATLTVEFNCLTSMELEHKINSFILWLKNESTAYAYPVIRDVADLDASSMLRKLGLGLIMGDPSGRKPIPFIEDAAIPLDNLYSYIQSLLAICSKYHVDTILYAHASVGVLHVRPELDIRKQDDIYLMNRISDEVFELVKKHKGSWSGEHGDGRNRGHKLKTFFGDEVYHCLEEVKKIFDPKHLLNPNIIIDVPPMDQHLRYGADYREQSYNFVYNYRHDHSFEAIVHNCTGIGVCRNHFAGTMCPSFKATSDEKSSTRGRANALRLAISGQLGFDGLTSPMVMDTLDLCLSCKACKSECPSNVDMAKLKSEVLQKKHEAGNTTLFERAISMNVDMGRHLAGWKAPLINAILSSKPFRYLAEKILNTDKRRILPQYSNVTLESWYRANNIPGKYTRKVALFADTYINYHETNIGKAAIRLLNQCGYEVVLASVGCCQRPRISNGFLTEAKEAGTIVAQKLQYFIDQGLKIVVCEPSCTSSFLDDLPDLLDDENLATSLQNNVLGIDVFLAEALEKGDLKGTFRAVSNEILLHGHCHQKSGYGYNGIKSIFNTIEGLKWHEPDTGCCGMAGAFGYEKNHYEVSKKIADLVLVSEIEKSSDSTVIVSDGFSCRHQISDFSTKKAIHWVECVEFIRD